MRSSYLNQLIDEFDQEFESLIIPFPKSYVVNPIEESIEHGVEQVSVNTFVETDLESGDANYLETESLENIELNKTAIKLQDDSAAQKLEQIKNLATKISAERYNANYNPEISLANLLNYILSADDQDMQNDFFQLLNQDNGSNLEQVLNDFDFYLDNPFKKKAEKILSKIEARKNK